MVWICRWMHQILFEWLGFGFDCFKSRSKGSNLHLNATNLFRIVRICIWTLEHFESLLNDTNLHLNALNPFQMVRICNGMLWILFKRLEFAFEWFNFVSIFILRLLMPFEWFTLDSNASNPFQMIRICFQLVWTYIWMLRTGSNGYNLQLNVSNSFRMVRICIWLLRISFKVFESAFECFEFGSIAYSLN